MGRAPQAKHVLIVICYLVLLLLLLPINASSAPDIPEENLAYPVLIAGDVSTGSGFLYNKKDFTYLVTARHVLFEETILTVPRQYVIPKSLRHRMSWQKDKNKEWILVFSGVMSENDRNELMTTVPKAFNFNFKEAFDIGYKKSQNLKLRNNKLALFSYAPKGHGGPGTNLFEIDVPKLFANGMIKYHPIRDVAYIKVGIPYKNGGQDWIRYPDGVVAINVIATLGLLDDNFKLFKDVSIGNEVYLFGYPASITQINPWMDVKLPLLRKGIIAGKNEELRSIILDCPVFFGNSGGLVMEVDRNGFEIRHVAIGIVSEYVSFEGDWFQNSSYSIVVPMDYIEELISGRI